MINNSLLTPEWLERLVALGRASGDAIMAIYSSRESWRVSQKIDDSPLTAADVAAHQLISEGLPSLLDLPILSEEGALPPFSERQSWEHYWLVDPLDGTKEFVAGNGQFTVNIALVSGGKPVVGLVHIPVDDITYLGVLPASGFCGAWKYVSGQSPQSIKVSSLHERYQQNLPLRILLSHRHGAEEVSQLIGQLRHQWPGGIEECHAGSSLKFCRIAEGNADFYPRLAPTSEWDTAAAQAVLEAAGGAVVGAPITSKSLKSLQYNKKEAVINSHFYALGDRSFEWINLLYEGPL